MPHVQPPKDGPDADGSIAKMGREACHDQDASTIESPYPLTEKLLSIFTLRHRE